MKKRITVGLVALAIIIGGVAAMSAFEAHIINVRAHIENALAVDPTEIDFGTVFPQEYLEKILTIRLSDSFLTEDRVDDIDYVIKQKPKCWNENPNDPVFAPVDRITHLCPDGFFPMLDLCPYLSKIDGDPEDQNDSPGELSYYDPQSDSCPPRDQNSASILGHLGKIEGDISDDWIIDLKVPPVYGYVGQDWPEDCPTVAENDKDYGCDLWIEVTGISLPNGIGCLEKADVILVLDRSGSIGSSDMTTLKNAAKAFVDALAPSADGIHVGMVSFASSASLDVHLTNDGNAVKTAIDGLGTSGSGSTNLEDAIITANDELEDPTYDRDDATSPDIMVIITDGNPTASNGPLSHEEDARVAADNAKADGIEIFAVGIGISSSNAQYMKDDIVSPPALTHYFDASVWSDLQAILEALATCN